MTATEHQEWVAFLGAIVAHPYEDTPRLVAADWLEENGQPERADFIRVQVELARLEASGLATTPEAEALRRKERVYLGPTSHYVPLWAAEECPELVRMPFGEKGSNPLATPIEGAERVTYRRGFIEQVTCPASEWLAHGDAVRERQPIRVVFLTGCSQLGRDDGYALVPLLLGLEEVALSGAPAELMEWLQGWLPGVMVHGNREEW